MIKIAQLSDPHLFADPEQLFHGVNPWQEYNKVVELITATNNYDLVMLTGDFSDDGSLQSYKNFILPLSSIKSPLYYVPGNHDDMSAFSKVTEQLSNIQHDRTFNIGEWCFVLLNSCYQGKDDGLLDYNEITFLEKTIQNNLDKHVVIFCHHHPLPIGSAFMDACMLTNGQEFIDVITKYNNVKVVSFGHIHQEFHQQVGNIVFLGAPSASLQLKPNSVEFEIDDIAPGYREIILEGDGAFATRIYRA